MRRNYAGVGLVSKLVRAWREWRAINAAVRRPCKVHDWYDFNPPRHAMQYCSGCDCVRRRPELVR